MISEFKKYVFQSPYRPALILNSYIARSKRLIIVKIVNYLIVFLLFFFSLLYLATVLAPYSDILHLFNGSSWNILAQIFLGLILILSAIRLIFFSVEALFYSCYYSSFVFDFKVAEVFYNDKDNTLLKSFFNSPRGRRILSRLDIKWSEINEFLREKNLKPLASPSLLEAEEKLTLGKLIEQLLINNEELKYFFISRELSSEDLKKAVFWVSVEEDNLLNKDRWWIKDNLRLIPSLANSWSFGATPWLDKYSEDIKGNSKGLSRFYPVSRRKEIEEIISLLTRSMESNVVLEGYSEEAKLSILKQLTGFIKQGRVPSVLEKRRVLLFKTNLVLAAFDNEDNWEKLLIKLFQEAEKAGNIILVIDNLPVFLAAAQEKKVNFLELISDYLISPNLQIIALASKRSFYQDLQGQELIDNRFEKVTISDLDDEETLSLIYEALSDIEKKYAVFFTQKSLTTLIESAGKYFSTGDSLQDQVMDLLDELITWPKLKKKNKIIKSDIEEFISFKTNIPLGEIQTSEKDILLNLEEKISQRVIGQEGAISLAVGAWRRARSGMANSNRPLGSFLFLGPTGVGKTETVKALAENFYGQEDRITRLDMSEYQGVDALNKLIGSFESGQSGIFSSLIREKNHGILLLDEFEKTTSEVMNLFLQILDEGYFSDMVGQKINARNLIIIATSNAGADIIWQMNKEGQDPSLATSKIIDHLVEKGIYRPELLNRFDAVVVFKPLSMESLKKIARLEINKLAQKLNKQGITLNISEGIVDLVAKRGADHRFGARSLKRYVEEHLENALATAKIKGDIKAGSNIAFDKVGKLKEYE